MSAVGMESSKVTVEYHDPSGIFPLISREITSRLPLRNLNWQTPSRPLRQIKSLHVDFVADKFTLQALRGPISPTDSNGPNSLDIVRGSGDQHKVKERRHQIPGFRTSPYLKIYVLRCDDKEAYKENDRRKLREWIREHAQPDGKREDHDACEWMILHVVIPDTIAASEPRWRESTKDPDELKERKGGSKLIGKSTRTVFDRLRADFNDSSKTGYDRIAQIRLPKASVPADLLPTPALAQTYEETAQERENAWGDLMTKFKILILGPFDRRVRQYETDIAEQDARRSLAGWNFCTFFIHKEGLAKALESIGLVEDALAIYDELSIGLETVVRDIASGQAQGTATSFAAYTMDFKNSITGALETHVNGIDETTNEKRDAATLFSKDYRERIVRSDISVFDFFCYIFTRQKALILRLANARSVRVQLGADANKEGGEDLVLTSEVCWRTSTFVHNAARTLRQDLKNESGQRTSPASAEEIESLVCSWIWTVTGQVLEETAAPALLDITKLGRQEPPQFSTGKVKRPGTSMGLGANTHPQRTTSLAGHQLKESENQRSSSRSSSRSVTQDSSSRPNSSSGADISRAAGLPGQAELATYRAELITMRRKMLEQLAKRRGWYAGWSFARYSKHDKLEEVNLDDETNDSVIAENQHPHYQHQILSPTLGSALKTEFDFQKIYQSLTEAAIRHYFAGTQSKSAQSFLGDLAMLKYQQGQYEDAVSYFQHVMPLLAAENWDLMELLALNFFAHCLKQLGQLRDYVQQTLTLLGKVVARRTAHTFPGIRRFETTHSSEGSNGMDVSGLFLDLIATGADLDTDFVFPLKSIFSGVYLGRIVEHDSETDAFTLWLHFRHEFEEEIELTAVTAVLIGYQDQSQQIELSASGPLAVKPGINKVALKARTVTLGPFVIGKITLCANRLLFIEEFRPPTEPTPLGLARSESPTVTLTEPEKPPAFIYVYPNSLAFHAELRRSRSIQIDKRRHLEVVLNSWRNHVDAVEISMRPMSAGLRLHLSDATAEGAQIAPENTKVGQVALSELHPYHNATVAVPYTVENAGRDVAIRLEIRYQVAAVQYVYLQSAHLSNELPLDVDVHDLFQLDTLYSNFTIRTTMQVPLTVLGAQLDDSPVYSIKAPRTLPLPLNVYKSQPVNLVYQITRNPERQPNIIKRDAALSLEVLYQPTDELAISCLRQEFTRDLERSEFGIFNRLLVPLLLERGRHSIVGVDLEMALLLGECRIPSFDAVGWEEIVCTLTQTVQERLNTWLRQWHGNHPVLALKGDGVKDAATQQIKISVDVPNVDMVFSTSLTLQQPSSARFAPPVIVLGQPLRADVCVKNTASWSAKSIFPNVPTFKIQGEGSSDTSFICDIVSESEAWALGGQRRSHFVPHGGVEHRFNIMLVPLKLGMHQLPPVEIHREPSDPETTYDSADGPCVSCETHYESAGRLVHVIRDVRTTKVCIEESLSTTSRPGTASTSAVG